MAFTPDKHTAQSSLYLRGGLLAILLCVATIPPADAYDLNTEVFGTGEFPMTVQWPKRVKDPVIITNAIIGQPSHCKSCSSNFSLSAYHFMADKYDEWGIRSAASWACIPLKGPGTLQSALQLLWNTHLAGRPLPYGGRGWGASNPERYVVWHVPVCNVDPNGKWGGTLHYRTTLNGEGTRSCAVSAPNVVELGNTTANVSKSVDLDVVCLGDGDWDVRFSVTGPTTVSPTDGLTLWTEPPRGPIRVEGDGRHYTVQAKFGATVTSPRAGPYSTSFIYTIEYD